MNHLNSSGITPNSMPIGAYSGPEMSAHRPPFTDSLTSASNDHRYVSQEHLSSSSSAKPLSSLGQLMIDHPLISKGFKSTFIGAASVLIAAALGAISLTSITAGIVVGAATELFGIAVETGITEVIGKNKLQPLPNLLLGALQCIINGVGSLFMATALGTACLTTGITAAVLTGAAAGILATVAIGLIIIPLAIAYEVVMAIKERSTDDKQALPA